jgi:hypothetical protein
MLVSIGKLVKVTGGLWSDLNLWVLEKNQTLRSSVMI